MEVRSPLLHARSPVQSLLRTSPASQARKPSGTEQRATPLSSPESRGSPLAWAPPAPVSVRVDVRSAGTLGARESHVAFAHCLERGAPEGMRLKRHSVEAEKEGKVTPKFLAQEPDLGNQKDGLARCPAKAPTSSGCTCPHRQEPWASQRPRAGPVVVSTPPQNALVTSEVKARSPAQLLAEAAVAELGTAREKVQSELVGAAEAASRADVQICTEAGKALVKAPQ
ncbi:hypothetical protein J0S82_000965 [Galemys pyrenaicus]|uniref:F1F0-ATP synthase delta subunit C-terminal domain-containing protein n=1 Tax=Galemys pyrenaicus TaxID=202257 RepID=A0A8J6AH71_GALPY|nr:hypothetical protein J0S82_000965 [Galemys pyrenaicus]